MNKPKLQFTSVSTLAVLLLAVMVLLGNRGQYIAAGILLVWGTVNIFRLCFPRQYREFLPIKHRPGKPAANRHAEHREAAQPEAVLSKNPDPVLQQEKPSEPPVAVVELESPDFEGILLQNIRFRITERLQSAFPEATWKWCDDNPLHELLQGTVRIQVFGTRDFTHADVSLERSGKIKIDMMLIAPLKKSMAATSNPEQLVSTGASDPDSLDLEDWYELSASCVLRATIDELFSRGYRCAYLTEDGIISVQENEQMVKQGRLEHMPGPMLWPDLLPLFEADDLTAELEDSWIKLSWND